MLNAIKMVLMWALAVTLAVTVMGGCVDKEGLCPEPEVENPRTCSFYLEHTEDVPNVLCRVPNGWRDPILASPPYLRDTVGIGVWVTAKRRVDDDGQTCGYSYGVIMSLQYRPEWHESFPDCAWIACTEFAELSDEPLESTVVQPVSPLWRTTAPRARNWNTK